MDKAAAIQKIRQQLTEGDIEAALQLLIEHLEPERKSFRDLNNRALQAKAQLEKAQRDELQGVVSFENSKLTYNQITQQIIRLVEEWEDPSLAPPPQLPAPRRKITPMMIMVAIALLAFIGLIIWQMLPGSSGNNDNDGTEVVHATDVCPDFDAKAFSIMILPYSNLLDPEANDSPHRPLARRLERYKDGFSGKATTIVFSKDKPTPNTDQDAILAAEECLAKLAIWGEYEHISSDRKETIITTNYKYLSSTDNFEFTMLNLDENAEVEAAANSSSIPTRGIYVDTIQNYSDIINKGELSEELENQFRLLFGVAILQSGENTEDGIALLEGTPSKDSSSTLLKEMALADAYMQKGDKKNAVEAYERVLKTHPNYWFAVNNWAMIYYEKGEYDKTLEALDEKLEEDPDNVNALTIRGSVRMKTSQLKEAELDLRKAERISSQPDREVDPEQQKYIRKKIDVLEDRKAAENKRIISANNRLNNDPNNLEVLTELAEANRNLGNYSRAKEVATRITRIDPDNLQGLAIKLESAEKTNDQNEVRTTTREVKQLDTSSQRIILEQRPILRAIIDPVRKQ